MKMIPKVIHYCWFGRNPLPPTALQCIESWKKYLPDYEIKEWNEDNFDVNLIPYTKEAYEAKKYAFVSDYARFWILFHHGGIYFDTDVKVIKSMDDLIAKGPFMGREAGAYIAQITDCELAKQHTSGLGVAPGLGLGAFAGMKLYKAFLDVYANYTFRLADGSLNMKTIVSYTTEILLEYGLNSNNDEPQQVGDIWIYPADYFCPMDHTQANKVTITDRTVSIHLYDCSWLDHNSTSYKLHLLKNWLSRKFGVNNIEFIVKILRKLK